MGKVESFRQHETDGARERLDLWHIVNGGKPSLIWAGVFPRTPMGMLEAVRFLRNLRPERNGAKRVEHIITTERQQAIAHRIDRPSGAEVEVRGPTWRDTRHLVGPEEGRWMRRCDTVDRYNELDDAALERLKPRAESGT